MADTDKKDPFIGKRFGEDYQITVVGRCTEISNGHYKYITHCSVCATDPEMFGNAEFTTYKSSLTNGSLPCGCGKIVKWTHRQYELRIHRECQRSNFTFLGPVGQSGLSSTAKINLRCNEDGAEWESKVSYFLRPDHGNCPQCIAKEFADRLLIPDHKRREQFEALGIFPVGTTFSRSSEKRDYSHYWDVTCGVCSTDEYVEAGLCTGVFRTTASELLAKRMPCRCSRRSKWTREILEFRIKRLAAQDGDTLFIGWETNYKNSYSKIVMSCLIHDTYTTTANSFINSAARCQKCAVTGFKSHLPASLYVLRVNGESTGFTKYGISNGVERRFVTHKREMATHGFEITDSHVFEMDSGIQAKEIETRLKRQFPLCSQSISGCRTEATYLDLYDDVVDFIEVELSKDLL